MKRQLLNQRKAWESETQHSQECDCGETIADCDRTRRA